jgi:hypothetical protein
MKVELARVEARQFRRASYRQVEALNQPYKRLRLPRSISAVNAWFPVTLLAALLIDALVVGTFTGGAMNHAKVFERAAYIALILFLARPVWTEFANTIRMTWNDVTAAAQALAATQNTAGARIMYVSAFITIAAVAASLLSSCHSN